MKPVIVAACILGFLIAAVELMDKARLDAQRLTASQCHTHPYSCFSPGVNLSSLR